MPEPKEKEMLPPGVMLYRGSRELFSQLPPELVKKLVLAMLDYEGPGTEPRFDDALMSLAWAALCERLELDRRRYRELSMTNRYKRFLREAQRTLPQDQCPDYGLWWELSEQGTLSAARTMMKLGEI